MTLEEFAEKFGVSVRSARNYIAVYYRSKGVENKKRRQIVYTPELVAKVAIEREFNHSPIDPETETDREKISRYMHVKYKQHEKNSGNIMKHKYFPQPVRIGKQGCKIYNKKDVEAFVESFFNGGPVHGKTRKITGVDATRIFFLTGRYWRYGESITTRLIHAREV